MFQQAQQAETFLMFTLYLVFVSDRDERVPPLHSYKFAAELQHLLPNNPNPLLLRVSVNSGHGGASTREPRIQEASDQSEQPVFFVSFCMQELGTRL